MAVVGTGTMGQGIAQVALVAGHPVRLYDAVPGRAQAAADAIAARLDRLVEKDRLTGAERDAARARLRPAESLADLADSGLVVEAVLERLDVKQQLLRELEDVVDEDRLLATNTSSLSVTAIGGALRNPGRFVGLHFFNPAPLLPLVEVVSGFATDVTSATRAYEMARAWGKTPVACADTLASSSTASRGPSTPRPSRSTRPRPPTPPPSTRSCASRAASGWAPSN